MMLTKRQLSSHTVKSKLVVSHLKYFRVVWNIINLLIRNYGIEAFIFLRRTVNWV